MSKLLDRLGQGPVICAEGYLFEFERRGYLQAGAFVPEVVLDHPELVAQLHREFVHAGSDVVEAFTYYAHREKLRLIGKEDALEEINRQALRIAAEVAQESGALLAGDVCNTNVYDPDDRESAAAVRAMFEEQVGWAVDAGADFIIGETFSWGQEALIALDAIKGTGLDAVITLAIHRAPETREGWAPEDACHGHVAALPVPYRTTDAEPSFQSLTDPDCDCIPGDQPFPTALDPFTCNRYELGEFTRAAAELGVTYLGVCCGAAPHHIRSVAEALGRTPPASRYSADMSRHAFLGSEATLKTVNQAYAGEL
jgi:betaine-homocysteine S-methyltransferase